MTPEHTTLLCLLAPLVGALGCLALRGHTKAQAGIAVAACAVSLIAALMLVNQTADGSAHAVHSGGWPAPFGIVLVADGFAALMLAICQLVVMASIIYGAVSLPERLKRRHLFPLVLTLSFGTNGAFLTGDLFNLYVWFEILLLSSFSIMAAMGGTIARKGTWRYVVINLVSSLLFLVAAGLVYGKTGTLNFADIRILIQDTESPFLIDSSAALLLGAFGIKAALIPLAFWLPASYPLLPPALSSLFAGLLTKVGLYAMYRVFAMVFNLGESFPHQYVLYGLALLTMIAGVLGAVGQGDMRRILSFHIISQVGYMALALALFTPLAIAAGIFYLVHHIVVKANLFLVTGLVEKHAGSSEVGRTAGVLHSAPAIALAFTIPALSLAGIPPLSGFFAKFALLKASLEANNSLAAITIVAVGLLTIFSMLKIWRSIFWGGSTDDRSPSHPITLSTSITLGVITVAIGLACGPIFDLAQSAADGLLKPDAYIEAVLGEGNPAPPTPAGEPPAASTATQP